MNEAETIEMLNGCLKISHRYKGWITEKIIDRRELKALLSADSVIEYMIIECQRDMTRDCAGYGDGAVCNLYRWWAMYCSRELGIMKWRMARDYAGGYAHPSGLPSVEIACFYSAAKAAEAAIVRNREIFVSNQQTLLSRPTLSPSTEEPPDASGRPRT
jgi:hypothetical protein